MIKWGSTLENYPELEFGRPNVGSHMRGLAEAKVPVPAHCKPWLDAQSAGLIVKWPHKETTIFLGPSIKEYEIGTPHEYVETLEAPNMRWDGEFIGRFAPQHFSLLPQYVFRTPPGVGLYVVGLPDDYRSPIDQNLVVRGILETDWYSLPPFFVFKFPAVYCETTIVIKPGDNLCMVVPVMLNPTAAKMSLTELFEQIGKAEQYNAERVARDDLLWYSPTSGQMFSHLYKERSRQEHKK